jgi:hypothetical protein
MAVFTEMTPATDYDRAHTGPEHDHLVFGEYWSRERIVEIGGREWRTNAGTLDRVAAGAARFDYRPSPSAYHPNGICYLVEHEGTTLADREENWPDDSDWYVLYWDAERNAIGRDGYRTTRSGGTDSNYAKVDATPEVIEAVRAKVTEDNVVALRTAEADAWREAADEAISPASKGAKVKVARGRKVPIGTEGTVFWVGEEREYGTFYRNGYNTPLHAARVGFKTDEGTTFFIPAKNLDRIVDLDDIPALTTSGPRRT